MKVDSYATWGRGAVGTDEEKAERKELIANDKEEDSCCSGE